MIVPRGTTGRSLFVGQTTLSHSLPPKKIRWNLKKRAPWTGNQFIFKSFTFGSMASLLGMQWPNGITSFTSTIFQSIELLCIFCSELKKQENMNKLQLELENVGRYALPLTYFLPLVKLFSLTCQTPYLPRILLNQFFQGAMEVNPAPKSSMKPVADIAKYRSKRVLKKNKIKQGGPPDPFLTAVKDP